ncbi:MAG: UDP-N-acetylmuramate dehydrogenase [Lachnospiraceae bacterium]|nr:UDP-N-acetylmuramate dehydrogenase [Lachnospiraceae bacterium]
MKTFLDKLAAIVKPEAILTDEMMKDHTTFRVGGPADVFVIPETVEEVKEIIKTAKEEGIPYYVVGNGSNLLVGDQGFHGMIIQIYKNMNEITYKDGEITAQAGALLSTIAKIAQNNERTGFEFASGIPGTLGGAVTMNAGAYGGEMKHVLKNATVLTKEGEILTLPVEDLELGYRKSVIIDKEYVVLEAVITLPKGNAEEIAEKMNEYATARKTKQPLEYPSAGSTFKRPTGYFAGKLIQDAGLRGYSVGGAQVSEKHCGFVINKGGATAADIVALMKDVNDKVVAEFGVPLEPEVKMIGEF